MSLPAEALNNKPTRTISTKFFNQIKGSGELPNDLDILRLCLSRTKPVKYTFVKGFFPCIHTLYNHSRYPEKQNIWTRY
jgi:hypothetical protein